MRPRQPVRRPAGTRQKPAETAKVILLYRPERRERKRFERDGQTDENEVDTHTDQAIIIVSVLLGLWLIGKSSYLLAT